MRSSSISLSKSTNIILYQGYELIIIPRIIIIIPFLPVPDIPLYYLKHKLFITYMYKIVNLK